MTILTPIVIDSATANKIAAGNVVQLAQVGLQNIWSNRVYQWSQAWNPNNALADVQAQIDLIASSGNLSLLLAIASAVTPIISTYRPDLFAQAVTEANGALQPNGQPYRKYVAPGWYYTTTTDLVTYPSGMVFSSPVIWSGQ